MRIKVLASGSKGNCTYIETEGSKILIDAGISTLQIEKGLKEIGVNPKEIDSIFITHSHVDHVSGIEVFSKKYKTQIYMTEKTKIRGKIRVEQIINIKGEIELESTKITPIKLSHDTPDANGYLIEENNKSVVYITDTGYVHEKHYGLLKNRSVYIFESNHDLEMLAENIKYPFPIKQRIRSDKGHLSNNQASLYLSELIGSKTKRVILAHLSEENNTPEKAIKTLKEKLKESKIKFTKIITATQEDGTELFEI